MRKIVASFFLYTEPKVDQPISQPRHFCSRRLAEDRSRVFHKAIGWFCYMAVHPVMLMDLEIFTLAQSIAAPFPPPATAPMQYSCGYCLFTPNKIIYMPPDARSGLLSS